MAAADPPASLVGYEPPLLVSGPAEVAAAAAASAKRVALRGAASDIEDIINSILPPRMWQQGDGTTWMQYVSKVPPSRQELATLQEQLDQRLQQRQARQTGICPVRSELYGQMFDELIRQVTLDLPERGLLLLRMRDELRMTLDAYKTLYDASVTFGVRKQLQAEQGMPELEAQVSGLSERKKGLEAQVLALRNKLDLIERRQAEKRALDDKRRSDEIAYLKHQAKHLDAFLKNMPK